VSVRVIPGGAAEGTEIAALQFTNDGKSGCTLVGYPKVVLLKNGSKIGSPSQPGGPLPGRSVPVAPGQTVQSMLRDYSSCQAPLSDTARVTVPGESMRVARPIELRACTLRVGQLGPPR
jgi:hypothetical protein